MGHLVSAAHGQGLRFHRAPIDDVLFKNVFQGTARVIQRLLDCPGIDSTCQWFYVKSTWAFQSLSPGLIGVRNLVGLPSVPGVSGFFKQFSQGINFIIEIGSGKVLANHASFGPH